MKENVIFFGGFIFIFFLYSCINPFAPKLSTGESEELLVTKQLTPDELLQNFRYAYTYKDSIVYSNLIDSLFIFNYIDYNEGARPVSWNRDIELKTTGRLLRSSSFIDLIWSSDPSRVTEWDSDSLKVRLIQNFNLTIELKSELRFVLTGQAELTLVRRAIGQPWKIFIWIDKSEV
jgi:hypothetical protein